MKKLFQTKLENLNQNQKQQRKELLTTFNKNTKSFIQQMEILSEKNLNITDKKL